MIRYVFFILLFLSVTSFYVEPDFLFTPTGDHFTVYEVPTQLLVSNAATPHENEKLPEAYTNRKFLKFVSGSAYNISTLPGNVVQRNLTTGEYELVSARAQLKPNSNIATTPIEDGLIYSNRVDKNFSLNGNYILGSFSVSSNQLMELLIQDVTVSFAPDTCIDMGMLKRMASNVPPERRKDYFFVKTVTLTMINQRMFNKNQFDADVSCVYVTAGGDAYNSTERFSRQRVVSAELISFENILLNE